MRPLILFVVNIIYKSATCNQLLHEFWERLSLKCLTRTYICDNTTVKINLNFISCFDCNCRLWTFNNWKTYINCISIKNACKSFCNNTAYSRRFNCDWCMFSRRTTSKVFICYDDIPNLYIVNKILINILHTMCCKFFWIRRI